MIKTLDLFRSTWGFSESRINTAVLSKILLKCGRFLTRINLSKRFNVDASIVAVIADHCPKLTSIDVTGLLGLLASDIDTLATNYRNITKFILGSPINRCVCDNELKYFFKRNQNLEYLAIWSEYNFFGESLFFLPAQTMHTIILHYCNNLRDNHLSMALKRLKNLKHFTINVIGSIKECTLQIIGRHCENLRTLELGQDKFYCALDRNISYFNRLVYLRTFKFQYNCIVSDDFLADLVKHCKQLANLDITGCIEVSDAGLAAVATLARLEKLIVSQIFRITDDGLKNICDLKELECRECFKFTDRGMSTFIKSSPELQLLDLSLCRNITNATLEVAKQACSNRTNNVMLKMIVGQTAIAKEQIGQEGLPPLLRIHNIPDFVCRHWADTCSRASDLYD